MKQNGRVRLLSGYILKPNDLPRRAPPGTVVCYTTRSVCVSSQAFCEIPQVLSDLKPAQACTLSLTID